MFGYALSTRAKTVSECLKSLDFLLAGLSQQTLMFIAALQILNGLTCSDVCSFHCVSSTNEAELPNDAKSLHGECRLMSIYITVA